MLNKQASSSYQFLLNESLTEEAAYHHVIKDSMLMHLHEEVFGCKLGADIFNLDVI